MFDDARERIESAADKHGDFLLTCEQFVYEYVKGMIKGFDGQGDFSVQLRKPEDSEMTGRPRMLAVEILEGVRSALDYLVFDLSERNEPTMNRRHPKFVIADDKQTFDAQANVALKYLKPAERSFIEALQPFSTNGGPLPVIRDAANRAKHRNLLKVTNVSSLQVVLGNIERKEEIKDWWCYPQDKGMAIFARGELRILMLGKYDAEGLLRMMIETGSKIVAAFDGYVTTDRFPDVRLQTAVQK